MLSFFLSQCFFRVVEAAPPIAPLLPEEWNAIPSRQCLHDDYCTTFHSGSRCLQTGTQEPCCAPGDDCPPSQAENCACYEPEGSLAISGCLAAQTHIDADPPYMITFNAQDMGLLDLPGVRAQQECGDCTAATALNVDDVDTCGYICRLLRPDCYKFTYTIFHSTGVNRCGPINEAGAGTEHHREGDFYLGYIMNAPECWPFAPSVTVQPGAPSPTAATKPPPTTPAEPDRTHQHCVATAECVASCQEGGNALCYSPGEQQRCDFTDYDGLGPGNFEDCYCIEQTLYRACARLSSQSQIHQAPAPPLQRRYSRRMQSRFLLQPESVLCW